MLRVARGVEQQVAAREIGVSPPYLSMLENDKKGTNLAHIRGTMERAATYYGVIPEYLLDDTPQEYMVAFIEKVGKENPELTTVGKRLSFVLRELALRWGEQYAEERVAEDLGVSIETLRAYQADRIPMADQTVLSHLTDLTGVPLDFFFPSAKPATEDDPAIRRVITMAVESGIPVDELEYVIQAWMIARSNTKKPSA